MTLSSIKHFLQESIVGSNTRLALCRLHKYVLFAVNSLFPTLHFYGDKKKELKLEEQERHGCLWSSSVLFEVMRGAIVQFSLCPFKERVLLKVIIIACSIEESR